MIWVSILKRKPTQSGFYYWKGKSGYGGKEFYNSELQAFEFDKNTPVNKVGKDFLYWLDESSAEYEEFENKTITETPQIEVGTILIAKDACRMNDGDGNSLVVGKEYPVIYANELRNNLVVKSEIYDEHYFPLVDEGNGYFGNYFTIKPTTQPNQ